MSTTASISPTIPTTAPPSTGAGSAGLTSSAIMNIRVLSQPPNMQIALLTNALVLSWSGGNPPFQIQVSTNLSSIWQNVGALVTNHNMAVFPKGASAMYRVQAAQ